MPRTGRGVTRRPRTDAAVAMVDRTCAGCPVRAQCLAYAVENTGEGVWGGQWHERGLAMPLTAPSGPKRVPHVPRAACGTISGYERHRRLLEAICEPSRQASQARSRAARARRAARAV